MPGVGTVLDGLQAVGLLWPRRTWSVATGLRCLWWILTLVVFATYTAILAAQTTHTVEPISSAEQLSNQRTVKIGTVKGGSTYSFFRVSCLLQIL